jgi:hypothetical protein
MPAPVRLGRRSPLLLGVILGGLAIAACGGPTSSSGGGSGSATATATPAPPGPATGTLTYTLSGADTATGTLPLLTDGDSGAGKNGRKLCTVPGGLDSIAFPYSAKPDGSGDGVLLVMPPTPGTTVGTNDKQSKTVVSFTLRGHWIYYAPGVGKTQVTLNPDRHSGSFSITGPWMPAGTRSSPPPGTPTATLSGTWTCTPGR